MVYKEMLVELVVNQYQHAKEILEDFPSESDVEKVVEELEDNICVDISVNSSDPDAEAEVKTSFERRTRSSATNTLNNQLSTAKTALENIRDAASDSLMQAMQMDLKRASEPNWSWDVEDEDTELWSAEEWLGHFQSIDEPEVFWKKVLPMFPPEHPYIKPMFLDNAVRHRYPLLRSFEKIYFTAAWEWMTPFLDKLKEDNGKSFKYQEVVDRDLRHIWTNSAVEYARSGKAVHKNRCELLESYGFTPAPQYLDLERVFASDTEHLESILNRLFEVSGVKDLLTAPPQAQISERAYSFQYFAVGGTLSSSAVLSMLKNKPDAANLFTKLILQNHIEDYSNQKQHVKPRKM